MNKNILIVGILFTLMQPLIGISTPQKKKNVAEWTITCFIQAYNNLEPLVQRCIHDMEQVSEKNLINVIVHWSNPSNRKSTRYLVNNQTKTELSVIPWCNNITPEKELVELMEWVAGNYPAKKHCLILWNRGYGLFNFEKVINEKLIGGWLQAPGSEHLDVFYDNPQETLITEQGLIQACDTIKKSIGKNIDLLCMDTSMMATIEVAYSLKNSVNLLLASQEIMTSEGISYAAPLNRMSQKPSLFSEKDLSRILITSYAGTNHNNYLYTMSAIMPTKIDGVMNLLGSIINELNACMKINALTTTSFISTARQNTPEMYVQDYVDIYAFCDALLKQIKNYKEEVPVHRLENIILLTQKALLEAIFKNQTGSDRTHLKGLSIYFPHKKIINANYANCNFAQNSSWFSLLTTLQNNM